MYISREQLASSIEFLDPVHPFFGISFLAFKQLGLQIVKSEPKDIAGQEAVLLERYYNPLTESKYYYVPLRAGGPKNRWVSKLKYPDSGLQKTRTTTFLKAFLHPNKNEWAWAPDYISTLQSMQRSGKIPTFHLAIWMFRDQDWPEGTDAEDIVDFFVKAFDISEAERLSLFDSKIPAQSLFAPNLFQNEPITWKILKPLTGTPPDSSPEEGGGIESLELVDVGPAKRLEIDFAQRLNIITGDNGLGKTFLLECTWWALSGMWADPEQPVYPRTGSMRPAISYRISGGSSRPKTVFFNRETLLWPLSEEKRHVLPGIVLYSRIDGSCMIWDPAKHYWTLDNDRARGLQTFDAIRLTQNNIWDGLEIDLRSGKKQFVCNGLIHDWILWQYRNTGAFDTFSQVLQRLSPYPDTDEITLVPGDPIKLPRDDREIPTLKLPYDNVPVTLLSAGIKRILSLAYLLVWTWEGHKEASKQIGKPPQSKIVFIIDEMEAHLHPRWQRVIVPALLDVVKILEARLEVQLVIATHSPLVLASVEPIFQQESDGLFTLELKNQALEIRELSYIKYGSVNSWLTSEVFDLKRAYSVDAEKALVDAKRLQLEVLPQSEDAKKQIEEVSARLVAYLPSIDSFWPRWKFFAEQYGVNL